MSSSKQIAGKKRRLNVRPFWLKVLTVLVAIIPIAQLAHIIEERLSVFSPARFFLSDFDYSDIYYKLDLNADAHEAAGEIVIITNAGNNTNELVALVEAIRTQGPKVIALDYMPDDDAMPTAGGAARTAFMAMLARDSSTVVAFDLKLLQKKKNYSDSFLPGTRLYIGKASAGFVNFSDSASTIRHIPAMFYDSDAHKNFEAFGLAVAVKFLGASASHIAPFFNGLEHDIMIKYLHPDAYTTIAGDAILKDPERYRDSLEGKIVLVGNCDGRDRHFTPLNPVLGGRPFPDMDGVYIHAGVIHSLLSTDQLHIAAPWRVYAILLLLVLLLTPLFLFFFERCEHIFHFPLVLLYEFIVSSLQLLVILLCYHRGIYVDAHTPHLIFAVLPVTIWLVNAVSYKVFEQKKDAQHNH